MLLPMNMHRDWKKIYVSNHNKMCRRSFHKTAIFFSVLATRIYAMKTIDTCIARICNRPNRTYISTLVFYVRVLNNGKISLLHPIFF